MPTQEQLTIFSPVKVNLYLRILGRRADGYHELETVMLPLNWGDELTFTPATSDIGLDCNEPSLPTDDRNLVVRAAKLLAEKYRVRSGVRIHLNKCAPLAAGLGAGSSNAAMTLRGLNRLWDLGANLSDLHALAAQLGSDVNFFLTDTPAICRGRGEQIEGLDPGLNGTILLVNPGFGISTSWAYKSWARLASRLTQPVEDVTLLARSLAANDLADVGQRLYNSLEAPSLYKFPVLALLKQSMREAGAVGALMSGSGATVFGLFADVAEANQCVGRLKAEFGTELWTVVTSPLNPTGFEAKDPNHGCPVV